MRSTKPCESRLSHSAKKQVKDAEVRPLLFCKATDKRGSPPFRKKSGCFFLQRGRGVGDMHFFAQCVK
ncbi:hypothetical protein DCO58_06050 [Helicobacter saguini]|uniref:Uncharacterized protein n=1 Tax=Helicobacter saguini TaxID=1548018 RepID=A0A4U8T452_9HELI|nr:hypothetical protein [Helicobacter saguini]MWV62097.1 hypothetical protein [Helicobacter saguini]MWV67231.1 hypothetical protein [Helicobacter saguini]MWV69584.1 hypothetical protein [Helicobacter saguini]MWV70866.1 hypothetical protein [Helicobacter saguini]TLD94300.1 hypothetical protein LS64_006170 [Helicobacter saguini]